MKDGFDSSFFCFAFFWMELQAQAGRQVLV